MPMKIKKKNLQLHVQWKNTDNIQHQYESSLIKEPLSF